MLIRKKIVHAVIFVAQRQSTLMLDVHYWLLTDPRIPPMTGTDTVIGGILLEAESHLTGQRGKPDTGSTEPENNPGMKQGKPCL